MWGFFLIDNWVTKVIKRHRNYRRAKNLGTNNNLFLCFDCDKFIFDERNLLNIIMKAPAMSYLDFPHQFKVLLSLEFGDRQGGFAYCRGSSRFDHNSLYTAIICEQCEKIFVPDCNLDNHMAW